MRHSSLAQRTGHVDSQATLLRAALIAAHAVHTAFRATDVRFFFRLFGNWLEVDVLRPSQDIELTQIRRMLAGSAGIGHAKVASSPGGARGTYYRLSPAGLIDLADKLVDECGPTFEEALFVLHFAASYRDILRARLISSSDRTSQASRRRLGSILDPRRVIKRTIRNCERLESDLRQRLASDAALERDLQRLRKTVADTDLVAAMTDIGAYQLERVQPLKQLLAVLPDDLRRTELTSGVAARRQLIFEPLLKRCEVELDLLRELERRLSRPS